MKILLDEEIDMEAGKSKILLQVDLEIMILSKVGTDVWGSTENKRVLTCMQ